MFRFIICPKSCVRGALMLLVPLLATTTTAIAAEPPPAPITITSNSAEFSRNSDVSTYTDDVVLTRGGLTLNGDKLVVKRLSDGTFRAELSGNPVTLHRTPQSKDDKPVKGHAQRVIYTSSNAQLLLRGDAVIKRDGDTIHGQTITQDLTTRHTVAESGSGDNNRVTVTLLPENSNDGGDDK